MQKGHVPACVRFFFNLAVKTEGQPEMHCLVLLPPVGYALAYRPPRSLRTHLNMCASISGDDTASKVQNTLLLDREIIRALPRALEAS